MMKCRRRSSGSGCGWGSTAALFRVVLVVGLVCLFCVGVLQNEAAKLKAPDMVEGGGSRKHGRRLLEKRHLLSSSNKNFRVNFVSKRRVPNGPDPIHNRRAGNSHRPPGRA